MLYCNIHASSLFCNNLLTKFTIWVPRVLSWNWERRFNICVDTAGTGSWDWESAALSPRFPSLLAWGSHSYSHSHGCCCCCFGGCCGHWYPGPVLAQPRWGHSISDCWGMHRHHALLSARVLGFCVAYCAYRPEPVCAELLLTFMPHCPSGLRLQNITSQIKLLRMSR